MSLINQFFATDHKRLDCLFNAFKQQLFIDHQASTKYFLLFKQHLLEHIKWEEQILFPLVEALNHTSLGPTKVMCREHQKIAASLNVIEQKLKNQDDVAIEVNELENLLDSHNLKEENVLYPMIDQCIDSKQLAETFLKMATINAAS